MEIAKLIHVVCAYATGIGFLLRGILAILESSFLKVKIVKILPHIIDTFLLVSGLFMAISLALFSTESPWLVAKIIALFIYIGFGLMILRWGETLRLKLFGLLGGLLTYTYIVGVAHSKSIVSYLIYM